ncbi:RHS repeat protein [Bacillus sp. ISL-18]|uniref:DUF6531 domain-containing protein n=1 Tax=Bacillus sp. ISL-18 TaxID=2819118 RepID=UPI001BE5B560|nr:DUF6531 domain-containing protein [Bacillus sp. ISL-18]MBT2655351.1 RHS repeat protein [Bacillus sp. ISL-18]
MVPCHSYNDGGETPLSNYAFVYIPGQETSYLGREEFWASIPVVGGIVNAFTGNLSLSETDFELDGRGPDVTINRTYNSQDTGTGLFGKGWYSNLEQKVTEQANGDVLFTDDDKTIHRFRKVATNQYEAPLGVYLELTKDGNGFYLKDKDQSITSFDTTGKLTSEKDDNGNKITYQYTSGKLTSITDASGRIISLQYQTDGFISNVTYETRVVSYTYNTGNLTEVKTPENRIDKYGYENGKLRFVYDPKHTTDTPSVTEYVYTTDKLTAVKDVLLKQTTLSYNTALREVTVTNPKGTLDVYTYSEAGNPVKTVMDSTNLKLTTTYQYENNNLIKKTDPKDQGVRTFETYAFDGNGNVTQETDAVGTRHTNTMPTMILLRPLIRKVTPQLLPMKIPMLSPKQM